MLLLIFNFFQSRFSFKLYHTNALISILKFYVMLSWELAFTAVANKGIAKEIKLKTRLNSFLLNTSLFFSHFLHFFYHKVYCISSYSLSRTVSKQEMVGLSPNTVRNVVNANITYSGFAPKGAKELHITKVDIILNPFCWATSIDVLTITRRICTKSNQTLSSRISFSPQDMTHESFFS